jgi:glucose-1-phosphate cytidylyltransferase
MAGSRRSSTRVRWPLSGGALMKVVLFCGGLGTRLRENEDSVPKPMVNIGYRPIMWHLMKYYAHHGHKDFILCLGYKADVIKQYFLGYNECLSNDFVLDGGGHKVDLLNSDIHDWKITFVDTGPTSPIGERMRRVREHLRGEEMFLANYSDCLTDLDLGAYVDEFKARKVVAGMVTVPPNVSFHYVAVDNDMVTSIADARSTPLRVNGGFFVFRQEIFDYINAGEELVEAPFDRLIAKRQLLAYEYNGFWKAMDTFKDKQQMDALLAKGNPPWEIWRRRPTE